MGSEFTGERVIPNRVDPNLWNEHMARYAFASRLSHNRRVLDLGCGSGYGAAELGCTALSVTGIDVAAEALAYACAEYPRRNLSWVQASCAALPVRDASYDLVVAFEVIEHLTDWAKLLEEARRVLAPGGQFIVSTPNKSYYAESRKLVGSNPFHEHEFEYDEFRDALGQVFPHVSLFLEDHTEGLLFKAVAAPGSAEVRMEGHGAPPQDSNFFIAVCAMTRQTESPGFVYLPSSANLLKERGVHIQRLESELQTKDAWLAESRAEHQRLVEMFREQTTQLQQRNAWAQELDSKLIAAGQRIEQLQRENAADRAGAEETVSAYAAKVAELEADVQRSTEWALGIDRQLNAKCAELAECVDVLHETERTLEERTAWALRLDQEHQKLAAALNRIHASRWVRFGRTFGVGPELQDQ